tara:strand:+ start:3922 stop:4461 length:540 start_codon:yes stop_codon:yes gene_type:complete
MKHYRLLFLLVFSVSAFQVQGQITSKTLVIGQFDKPDERYAIEVAITELFTKNGIPSVPSLNVIKQGANPSILALDSVQSKLKQAGIDRIAIINVRGYDRRFKISNKETSLKGILERTSIYHIYREEATSVSFEFTFYKENKMVFRDILKCGNISDRDSVIKRIRKKLPKRMSKKWSQN